MEAGTGIEPVFTDLQSCRKPQEDNALGAKKYQDIPGTRREPDTVGISPPENENPGATAIATGAEFETANFKTVHYRLEAEWATALVFCLGRASDETGAQICTAYLDDLRTEGPVLALFTDIRGEAEFWADSAHVHEIEAVTLAGLRRLGEMALGVNSRKRLFAALWDSFDDVTRLSFARKCGMIGGAS